MATTLALACGSWAHALRSSDKFTLQDLEAVQKLTPGDFADLFEYFKFSYSPLVQTAGVFLGSQAGDCDDYAILADHVLRKRGYTTRLVQVRMIGMTYDHAVCYVDETQSYLDYNLRQYTFNLKRSKPFLRDIAGKVAGSLGRNWTVAFEFTYSYLEGRKKTRHVVVKTEDPARDPDRQLRPSSP